MTVYVLRDGALVPKGADRDARTSSGRSDFPAPMLSRMEPFESPVTGKEITSWRERERDMRAADAVDPRDLPPSHEMRRGRLAQAKEAEHARRSEPDPGAAQWGRLPE